VNVRTKRIYDPEEAGDGQRILVDGLWPRGISRERAHIDEWAKAVAPSAALRKWFGHDAARWEEFRRRYFRELDGRGPELERLLEKVAGADITLLYAASDRQHNNAAVLKEYIENRVERGGS
jgi:uncharacterized protein YeaO (DUF488 family)